MHDVRKTKTQLLAELAALRNRVAQLETTLQAAEERPPEIPKSKQAVTETADVGLDSTRRKEKRFLSPGRRSFIESILAVTPGVIYLHEIDEQRSVVLSAHNLEILGYTSADFETLVGRSGHGHLHPEDRARIPGNVQKLQDGAEGQVIGIEYRIRHKDGTWKWCLSREIVFSRTADGRVRQTLGIAVDIHARKQAEEALQALSRQLLESQEHERQHLAHELHDEFGQSLTVLLMNLRMMEAQTSIPARQPLLHDSVAQVESLIAQVRRLSVDLRPPMLDLLGIADTLHWYLQRQSRRTGIAMELLTNAASPRPVRVIEETCFRVVQEAITNVIRHANAQNVWVGLQYTDTALRLSIRDDGEGFDPDAARRAVKHDSGIGLLGMEERLRLIGGTVVIRSMLGEGTDVQVAVPLALRA